MRTLSFIETLALLTDQRRVFTNLHPKWRFRCTLNEALLWKFLNRYKKATYVLSAWGWALVCVCPWWRGALVSDESAGTTGTRWVPCFSWTWETDGVGKMGDAALRWRGFVLPKLLAGALLLETTLGKRGGAWRLMAAVWERVRPIWRSWGCCSDILQEEIERERRHKAMSRLQCQMCFLNHKTCTLPCKY